MGDEIYLKAGAEIPSRRHYGNYPQIEDGVGMIRSFLNVFDEIQLSEPPADSGWFNSAVVKSDPRCGRLAQRPNITMPTASCLPATALS